MGSFFVTIWSSVISFWNLIFFHPILNILVGLYKVSGGNFGIAVILLTIILRLLLWPLLKAQIQSAKNMAKIQPRIKEIQKKYKNDVLKLREEQMKIFKEEGVNPAGSCLSVVVQFPFLIGVYEAIIIMSHNGATYINKLMYFPFLHYPSNYHYNLSFFVINVGKAAADFSISNIQIVPYIILALLVGYSQYLSTKVSLPITENKIEEEITSLEIRDAKGAKGKDAKKSALSMDPSDMGNIMTKQMLYIMPVFTAIISLGILGNIPSALSLYWMVQAFFIFFQSKIMTMGQKKMLDSNNKAVSKLK